jgi:hypothetical protein
MCTAAHSRFRLGSKVSLSRICLVRMYLCVCVCMYVCVTYPPTTSTVCAAMMVPVWPIHMHAYMYVCKYVYVCITYPPTTSTVCAVIIVPIWPIHTHVHMYVCVCMHNIPANYKHCLRSDHSPSVAHTSKRKVTYLLQLCPPLHAFNVLPFFDGGVPPHLYLSQG